MSITTNFNLINYTKCALFRIHVKSSTFRLHKRGNLKSIWLSPETLIILDRDVHFIFPLFSISGCLDSSRSHVFTQISARIICGLPLYILNYNGLQSRVTLFYLSSFCLALCPPIQFQFCYVTLDMYMFLWFVFIVFLRHCETEFSFFLTCLTVVR